MYKTILTTLLVLAASTAMAGTLNIQRDRYIEARHLEAHVNADLASGTIGVRPADCRSCPFESYPFDSTLMVMDGYHQTSISELATWGSFAGDIVITRVEGHLVAVKRQR